MASAKLKVKKDGEKFAVVDATGKVMDTGYATRAEAQAAISKFQQETGEPDEGIDHDDDLEDDEEIETSEGDTNSLDAENLQGEPIPEPKTEHNPHGLSAHERIARLIERVQRAGISYVEGPLAVGQHPSTGPQHFAHRATEGQNAPAAEPETSVETTEE